MSDIFSSILSPQASKYNIGTNWFMIPVKILKFFLNRKQFVAASSQVQVHTLSNTFVLVLVGEWAAQGSQDRPKTECGGPKSLDKNRTLDCVIFRKVYLAV